MLSALPDRYSFFLPRFYRLATVSIFSNMMVPLAGLCDTAFLGHLNDIRYLAGVILASILFDYLYRVLKFLRNSTNAMTAQAMGQEDREGVILAALRSGLIALAIAAIILCLQYPIQKLGFAILSGSPAIEASGIEYFNARIWGAPAVLLNFVFLGWFLGKEMNWVVLIISLIANGSNVLLDYFMISRWGWGSMGAGLATAISQYLALGFALISAGFFVRWRDVAEAIKSIFDRQALRSTLVLKGNILVRFVALISVYAIFTNLSATMGTTLLAENGLLLQIALLSQFTVQGIGMTTQTLVGNFKGQGNTNSTIPLMATAMLNSLSIALIFALASICFPQTVFGLLTNHTEINGEIANYTIWLLPLLCCTAIAFMLEGYFIGLKEGAILRNASLLAFVAVFAPLTAIAWHFQSVHLLWTAITLYMGMLALLLGEKFFKMQQNGEG